MTSARDGAGDGRSEERWLDEDERETLLLSLLQAHPGAVISGVDVDGRVVDLPASIEHPGQPIVAVRSALDLAAPGSRTAILDAGARARLIGAASTPVLLINGVDAVCHVIDVRGRHGVLVGIVVADADIDLHAALVGRPPIVPRHGRIDKDDVAIIRFADDRICRILGYDADELVGGRSLELIHPDDRPGAIDAWVQMLASPGEATRLRARHRRRDGSWVWMELTNTNRLAEDEGCVVTDMMDISAEMAAAEILRQREELLSRLAEAMPLGVLHVDAARNVVYTNSRLHRIIGVGVAATVDEQLANVIPADRHTLAAAIEAALVDGSDGDLEVRLRLPGAVQLHLCSIALRALTDADGAPAGAVLCIDDVTEAAQLRDELERRATVDELTGCLNRTAVLDELDAVLRRHAAGSPGTAVAFVDLDGFKVVNDTFGHKAGDQLLSSVAARLTRVLRSGDAIGRLGGDEFIIVLASISSLDEAIDVAARLADALAEPLEIIGGTPTSIRSSIGVAWACADDITADTLITAADNAMYESKRASRSQPVCVVAVDSSG